MMDSKKLFNIDWLTVYCNEPYYPRNAEYYRQCGYYVEVRDYGTPHFKEMFTICDERQRPLIEVRRDPKSLRGQGGVFQEGDCHLRLSNRSCYMQRPIEWLRGFLLKHGYMFNSVSRIDICCDFVRFDNGMLPEDFAQWYIQGVYGKINQSRINAHGSDDWALRRWHSLSWGSPTSAVRTRMYNKTLEQKQVATKPWIYEQWDRAGLLCSNDVWRVEFSLSSQVKQWKQRDSEHLDYGLSTYESREKLSSCWFGLADHYFHFKELKDNVRKYRCPDIRLFNIGDDVLEPYSVPYERKPSIVEPDPAFLCECARISQSERYHMYVRLLCRELYRCGLDVNQSESGQMRYSSTAVQLPVVDKDVSLSHVINWLSFNGVDADVIKRLQSALSTPVQATFDL